MKVIYFCTTKRCLGNVNALHSCPSSANVNKSSLLNFNEEFFPLVSSGMPFCFQLMNNAVCNFYLLFMTSTISFAKCFLHSIPDDC